MTPQGHSLPHPQHPEGRVTLDVTRCFQGNARVSSCCPKTPVCGHLLQQPRETNTNADSKVRLVA